MSIPPARSLEACFLLTLQGMLFLLITVVYWQEGTFHFRDTPTPDAATWLGMLLTFSLVQLFFILSPGLEKCRFIFSDTMLGLGLTAVFLFLLFSRGGKILGELAAAPLENVHLHAFVVLTVLLKTLQYFQSLLHRPALRPWRLQPFQRAGQRPRRIRRGSPQPKSGSDRFRPI